jgi:signal transduction histidine kinase
MIPGSWSLKTRIALQVALVVATLAVALAAYLPARLDAVSRGWAASRVLGIGRVLASASEAPLDFEDPRGAAALLETLESTRGAVGAVVLASDGRALARWGREPAGQLAALGGEAAELVDGVLRVRVPIATRAGRVGALVLDVTITELAERRAETRRILGVALGIALLAGVVGAAAVGAITARPLQRMTAVARRIAAGDLAAFANLERSGGAETRALSAALDVMLQRLLVQQAQLATRSQEIEGLNAQLEARVATRTEELERTNRTLAVRLEELRRTQQQLIVADRRVSLGQLAAGVAHEINNPLAYVMSNLAEVQRGLGDTLGTLEDGGPAAAGALHTLRELARAVRDALDGAERVRHIVKGLKSFSRTDDDERAPLDPSEPLAAAIEMAGHQIRPRAALEKDLGPLPRVEANAVRLSQVFLNLLVNAAQALPEGQASRQRIRVATRTAADGFAEIEVSDTGAGIAPEHLPRIFDPFFTTKPVGEGTGLGLSICQGIVTGLSGRIDVESEPGRGTTFRVRLPPSSAARLAAPALAPVVPPAASPEPRAAEPGDHARRRVLVIDDEPLLHSALRRLLLPDHDVEAHADARRALDRLRAGERFDAILCDLMMPGMDGIGFHEALVEIAPEQAARLVFMTGGAHTERTRRFLDSERRPVLEKPIDPDRLRRIVDAPSHG